MLTLRSSEVVEARCEHCGSSEMDRMMSRFAVARSDESRLDSLSDPAGLSGLDENDPRSMARWMRKMGKQLGDEMSGPEFDEMVDELESGGFADDESGSSESDGGEPEDSS